MECHFDVNSRMLSTIYYFATPEGVGHKDVQPDPPRRVGLRMSRVGLKKLGKMSSWVGFALLKKIFFFLI